MRTGWLFVGLWSTSGRISISPRGCGRSWWRMGSSLPSAPAPTKPSKPSAVSEGLLLLDLRAGRSGSPQPEALDPAAILGQAKALDPAPTWVCLADGTNLSARLEALRGGASACFTTPPPDLAARLLALLGAAKPEPYRVLVVDDQEVSAILAGGILNHAGMVVRTVFDPMTVLQAMDEFRPDLVLMDLHMPGANGMELTSIIREHETFCATPIVFLSVEEDPRPSDRRPARWWGRVPDQAGGPGTAGPDGAPARRARPLGEGAAGLGTRTGPHHRALDPRLPAPAHRPGHPRGR